MDAALLRRAEDLWGRCERAAVVTHTGFLTPAEQYELNQWARGQGDCRMLLSGGQPGCQRQAAFFLPYYLEAEGFDPAEYIRAVRLDAFFGQPTHRDYMGAALGLGIGREWLGDIRVDGAAAYMFCLPSVEALILENLTKAGRCTLKPRACPLADVPPAELKLRPVTFTVKSLRLDAVAGAMFGLSRSAAADLIRAGAASLNYVPCQRTDAPVKEGDVISLRGQGKGVISAIGGKSRKDRQFVEADIYI